ncbi:hypothetical protein RUMCAL_00340 [Ruminococcus callidus ATCC 27760]|uniref:Uncharacterized protein n=1 Tax=Ruminococcus callidus ATCC 27760 TaxID=411473 RepID=U2MD79_9FIRM|nr:hypothetical protein RUMCAL_00340 [Ruminococcus callidus ATCC 27760]
MIMDLQIQIFIDVYTHHQTILQPHTNLVFMGMILTELQKPWYMMKNQEHVKFRNGGVVSAKIFRFNRTSLSGQYNSQSI